MAVGEDRIPADEDGTISLEGLANPVEGTDELCEKVFPNLQENYRNKDWLSRRGILAPKHKTVDGLNFNLIQQLPGETRTYKSFNNAFYEYDECEFPRELLKAVPVSGVPDHILNLKIGAPIMMLRNLDPTRLCNGTRLVVICLADHLIKAEVLTGIAKGEMVFIPKIPFIPEGLAFKFKRIQFPVRLCFSMTIKKARGHTLDIVGLHLLEPCFSHGQLYVALSRVGSPNHIYAYTGQKFRTKNKVIQNVYNIHKRT